MTIVRHEATIDDLYRVPENGKAELVNGEIVRMSPTGRWPGRAGGRIYLSLDQHERATGSGTALPDNVGFIVNLRNRRSFSPDAAWYVGPDSEMRFLVGAPRFAAEVRSENDYGDAAEEAMTEKRRDYFAAGTLVVWDVDLQSDDVVRKYTAAAGADLPAALFRRGEIADAEPAIPDWSMPVDDLVP
jgi:Uma2 family endonuclease